jgi:hypothetical protein
LAKSPKKLFHKTAVSRKCVWSGFLVQFLRSYNLLTTSGQLMMPQKNTTSKPKTNPTAPARAKPNAFPRFHLHQQEKSLLLQQTHPDLALVSGGTFRSLKKSKRTSRVLSAVISLAGPQGSFPKE